MKRCDAGQAPPLSRHRRSWRYAAFIFVALLLRTSDPHLPAEDIALGYKQLLEVERGWRT